jgi:hypothetical protein
LLFLLLSERNAWSQIDRHTAAVDRRWLWPGGFDRMVNYVFEKADGSGNHLAAVSSDCGRSRDPYDGGVSDKVWAPMSRLFNIPWTEKGFLLVFAFVGPALYALTALGLFYGVRLAGFMAWFIFIGPGVAEFTHFIFPLLRPALSPELAQGISHTFPNGAYIADMPNYYVHATARYYFAGMYTAALPVFPGIYAIYRLIRADRHTQ